MIPFSLVFGSSQLERFSIPVPVWFFGSLIIAKVEQSDLCSFYVSCFYSLSISFGFQIRVCKDWLVALSQLLGFLISSTTNWCQVLACVLSKPKPTLKLPNWLGPIGIGLVDSPYLVCLVSFGQIKKPVNQPKLNQPVQFSGLATTMNTSWWSIYVVHHSENMTKSLINMNLEVVRICMKRAPRNEPLTNVN